MSGSSFSRSPLHGRHSRRNRAKCVWRIIGLTVAAAAVIAAAVLLIPRLIRQVDKPAPESSAPTSTASEPMPESSDTAAWTKEDPQWMLRLVNPWNRMPDGYVPELTTLTNGLQVDSRCYPALQQMMDDCRLFNTNEERLKQQGMTQEQAETETAKAVAVPGTSEHQLGLALDIVDKSYQLLEEDQQNTPAQQWLMANCWKYGFILRFPKDKEAITGITYEPWHYRYVGEEAAKAITESGISLEEYLQ